MEQNEIPKDKWNFVFWVVFLIGFTILLPWNILITVEGFWKYKFRNVSLDGVNGTEDLPDSDLQKVFGSYVAIASNVPNATFIVLHAIIGHKIPMTLKLYGSQVGMVITLLLITVLSRVNSDSWQDTFLGLTIFAIVLINAFSAVFQGCASSLLSPFPHEYLGHWVNGAGMGGLFPSILNVIFLAINPDPKMSGFACFVFSLSVTMICYGLTFAMERSEFYQHYYVHLAENQTKAKEDDRPMGCQKMTSVLMETFKIYCDFGYSVWNYILITLINFTTTLCVFPAVCQLGSSYEYQKTDWDRTYYVAVCCFLVFNLADYAGKQLAVWIQLPRPSKIGQTCLLIATILRTALIPLFMFSNVSVGNRKTEIIFLSDAYYITFMIILGVSNGYIGNIAMMFGPKCVRNIDHQGTAAAAIVAVLVIGCGIGSVISNALVEAL